jgi:agmatine/peptidylarginine deiminase
MLLNNYCDFDKTLRKKLLAALNPHFNIVELHYGAYTEKSWAYLNFLHVGQHIFVPMLQDKLAVIAFKQISAAYPQCDCHQIWGCDNIVREGGALNCCTWNILAD